MLWFPTPGNRQHCFLKWLSSFRIPGCLLLFELFCLLLSQKDESGAEASFFTDPTQSSLRMWFVTFPSLTNKIVGEYVVERRNHFSSSEIWALLVEVASYTYLCNFFLLFLSLSKCLFMADISEWAQLPFQKNEAFPYWNKRLRDKVTWLRKRCRGVRTKSLSSLRRR